MPYSPQGSAAAAAGTQGNCQVSVVQYTGNYSGTPTTNAITGVGFESDFIMIFAREDLNPNGGPIAFWASGDTYGISIGGTFPQWPALTDGHHISVDSDGFTVRDTANANTYEYMAVCFKLT